MFIASNPVFSSNQVNAETNWEGFDSEQNVPLNKEWTITFNDDVDVSSLTSKNIYVLDPSQQKVNVTLLLLNEGNQVIVQPPEEGYLPNTSYSLYISEDVYSKSKKLLKKPVRKNFTTGTEISEEEAFIAREDSHNSVELKQGIISLPKEILDVLLNPVYEENSFTFAGAPEELKNISGGDIIILPPTSSYPYGWSKEVISCVFDGTNTVIKTIEPNMEEVIENIDISKVIPIEAKDMTLDPEVYPNIVSQSGTGNKRTFKIANSDGNSVGTIKFGMEGENPYIEFSGVELLPEGQDHGAATLGGKLKLLTPEVHLDSKWLSVNRLEFTSGIDNNLNVKFELSGQKEEATIPLGVPIPIKAYGIAGAQIQFFIKFTAEGQVYLDFEVTNTTYYNVGIKKVEDDWRGFNRSKMDASAKMNSLTGIMEGKMGAGVNVQAQVLQFTLAGVDIAAGYKTNISGQVSIDEVCFRQKDEIYVEATAQIGSEDNSFWDVEVPILSKPLTHKSTCGFKDILVDSIELKTGEAKQLTLKGVDKSGQAKEIELPDSSFDLESENKDIVTVNDFGKVIAKSNVMDGDATNITIKYDNGSDPEVTKTVKVLISSGVPSLDKMKEMVETIGSDISEVLISGWENNDNYGQNDFSTLEDDLKELATNEYIYGTLESYYEDYMCYECDSRMFPWEMATDLSFQVLESSSKKLVLQTVELTNEMTTGGFVTYTFKKENAKWLLDDYDFELFNVKPLNVSAKKAQEFLTNYYLDGSYYNYNEVEVAYSSTGTEIQRDWYTGQYHERTYYIFDVTTDNDEFKVKFFNFNGYFYSDEYQSFNVLSSFPQQKRG